MIEIKKDEIEKQQEGSDKAELIADTHSAVSKVLATEQEFTPEQQQKLFNTLEDRLSRPQSYKRPEVEFAAVKRALEANPEAMLSLAKMEATGGLPDIMRVTKEHYYFIDCSHNSPRCGLTYDQALQMADDMGVDLLPKKVMIGLRTLGDFDTETDSFIKLSEGQRDALYDLSQDRMSAFVNPENDNDTFLKECPSSDIGWRGVLRVPRV